MKLSTSELRILEKVLSKKINTTFENGFDEVFLLDRIRAEIERRINKEEEN